MSGIKSREVARFGSEHAMIQLLMSYDATLENVTIPATAGMDVVDLREDAAFQSRALHARDAGGQVRGLQRLARALAENPDTILQELAEAAVELCGADSAGISLVKEQPTAGAFYEWVGTAGRYSGFTSAVLPQYPSACGVTLERGTPQRFRVHKEFFDILGVQAPLVTDGLLLPWQADETRGTIFIMAHGRSEAFDAEDCRLMETLADFTAMAVRQRRLQARLIQQVKAGAAASMANELAHQINNPLQSLTNRVYLATVGHNGPDAASLARELEPDLQRLSKLVGELLALPIGAHRKA